ncbi:RB1-inducible coiled-coil protein 1 isoform X2 [Toxorhynchites rutilus septentrionalis]|uniref:RB1-inducible coiled-coil protein 1 isoform X2 n=1 Tax=Toxorhynchites rutilus septentrionalis TaxID=329112 RepID=UPI002479F699|nr:RB1-inducible coiled-coil protein 1 isoform X2 [Toxorhynchites rutilus septentrionalis]
MLFVFHVETGRMLTFEMGRAMGEARCLKQAIHREHGLPYESIVLLISGGELLRDSSRVCNFSCGTDTNPIYMFSTSPSDSKDQPHQPWPSIESDNELKAQVDRCLDLPAEYNTVVRRAQLAHKFNEMAKEEVKICVQLVYEQHLQQQGWAAIVANMEDVVAEFQERFAVFERSYEEHKEQYSEQGDFLPSFGDVLEKLADIPILSTLMKNADSRPFGAFDELCASAGKLNMSTGSNNSSKNEATSTSVGSGGAAPVPEASASAGCSEQTSESAEGAAADVKESVLSENDKVKCISLLDWLSASEGQKTIKRIAQECHHSLDQLEKFTMPALRENVKKAVELSQREDMKEIKGLGQRLGGLDQLMVEVKQYEREQAVLAQSFQQNQIRAGSLGDISILPDLCATHRSQLVVLLQNQRNLRDIRRRCTKAKDELCANLVQRLRYIMHVETKVFELDNSLLFYHSCLKRLQRYLGIIEQIQIAPCLYVSAVTEVVRRRMFSGSFLKWASDLASRLMTIHNDEVVRRHNFTTQFEGHFLNTLFPGLEDMPPQYAIPAPSVFDSSLPSLDKQDLEELSRFLPELTEKIQLPNLDSVIDFFSSRSVEPNQSKTSELKSGENVGQTESENALGSESATAHQQTKDGGESETDTEEFEDVGPSTTDRRHRGRVKVESCSMATSTEQVQQACAETLTEENLGTTRIEVEKLSGILRNMDQLSQSSIAFLREQLAALKAENVASKAEFRNQLESINKSWSAIQDECRNREREMIQQLTVDHELEMNDLKKSIHQKDDEIQSLRSDNTTMKASLIETVSKYESEEKELNDKIDEMKEEIRKLTNQVEDAQVDQKKAIQEAVDQLEHKHKNDIESLRCRYKLMTSMDRSPSDTSLEKIERPDVIDIASHEQLMAQVREDFNDEKELAIKTAVDQERQRWEATLKIQEQRSMASSSPGVSSGSHECYKRILEEKERQLDELREKEALLVRENQRCKETIQLLSELEVSAGQVNMKYRIDDLELEKENLKKELDKLQNKVGAISIQTCAKGDAVLIVYNATYEQYTIVQNAPCLYFLHAESYQALNLPPLEPGMVPKILHTMGIVVNKDYCHARKDKNRYKVSQGTRFYRVSVKALPSSSGSVSSTSASSSASKSFDNDKSSKKSKDKMSESSRTSSTLTNQSASGHLIDSFAQTEHMASSVTEGTLILTSTSQDMTDSGVAEQQKSYKERTTSATDEEDITYSRITSSCADESDLQCRLRNQSVCEEVQEDLIDSPQQETITSSTTARLPGTTPSHSLGSSASAPIESVGGGDGVDMVDGAVSTVLLSTSTGSIEVDTSNLAADEITKITVDGSGTLVAPSSYPQSDDVSDSADSEYRSLENKDDDSDALNCGLENEHF